MKKDQIEIGGTYLAKVTDKIVPVRIERENPRGGWDATNMQTQRPVRIKSPQRLRSRVQSPEVSDAKAREAEAATSAPVNSAAASTRSNAKTPERKPRQAMSCLDAAAKVLEESGEPMNTKAMVEAMEARGYWTSDAPTPAATLYSAILRELQKKGDQSRFTKVERGKFVLAKGA